ncbi:MAG: site-specific integrase, partial [Selenomonadales bacterium]|nr:site-specific integrase [Selenomonadales bacterium]
MKHKKQYALPSFADLPKSSDLLTEEEFLANPLPYMQMLSRSSAPSRDTSATYRSHLNQFLEWCRQLDCSPFVLTREQLTYFRDWLLHCGLKPAAVALKLTVIRHFYAAAVAHRFTAVNPALRLSVRTAQQEPTPKKSLTIDEVAHLFSVFPEEESLRTLRDKLLLSFMVLEGVRIVELHEMNESDIDLAFHAIRLGREMIYPRDDTFELLSRYLAGKGSSSPDASGKIPVFTVLGNHNYGNRMSRQSIRDAINDCLDRAGLKKQGVTCHTL